MGMGARPLGMCNAFVALSDDINCLYSNCAGLAQLKGSELSITYDRLFPGLEDATNINNVFLGYGRNLGNDAGSIGVGWMARNLSDLYYENAISFSYARENYDSLLLGVSAKIYILQYSQTAYTQNGLDNSQNPTGIPDPVFANGYSAYGFGIDAGLIYKMYKNLSVGLMLTDVNQPRVYLSSGKRTPITIKTGLNYKIGGLNMAMDVSWKELEFELHGGAESWFFNDLFAIRGGFGWGTQEYRCLSCGASYCIRQFGSNFRIDYALLYYLTGISPLGNHHVSLHVIF